MRLIEGVVMLVTTVVVVSIMDPRLAFLSVLSVPVLTLQAYYYSKRMRPLWLSLRDKISPDDLVGRAEPAWRQSGEGLPLRESAEIQRFAEQNSDWLKTSEESVRIRAISDPLVVLIASLA